MNVRAATIVVLAIAALLGGTSIDLTAQVATSPTRVWFSGGLGVGRYGETGGAVVLDLAYQSGAHLLALRASAVLTGYELGHSAGEIGLLYGRASRERGTVGHVAGAVGLSMIKLDLPGGGLRSVLGIPFGFDASVNAQSIGLGLKGFATLNTVQSFGGLVLSLRLGQLR